MLVSALVCASGRTLTELVAARTAKYPCSGEINSTVKDPKKLLEQVENRYQAQANQIDDVDGLSMSFDDWRFNLRMSNTEPVVRLNVETLGDSALMRAKRDELLAIIQN